MKARRLPAGIAVLLCAACSSSTSGSGGAATTDGGNTGTGGSGTGDSAAGCAAGMEPSAGKCIDPLRRYEPAERIDFNNVVSYDGAPLTMDLPEPPKSGFRLVVPTRHLKPGDEIEDCHAWAYPAIQNHAVYAARVYTNGGLHHSNMYGVPLAAGGASPYPGCATGQGNVMTQVPNFITGNIMDVLFANSTQIDGGEQIVFHTGMAFKIQTDGREVATTIHWLNTGDTEVDSEVVYDFFTMPDADVVTELVPFVFENQEFSVPPKSVGDITTTCTIGGTGNIVSIMPHTHKRATAFDVELIAPDGTKKQIFHDGNFDTGSEITVFDEPIPLEGMAQMHHTCTVNNDLSVPIIWGIGDMEMCTLFGYMYPPKSQEVGYVGKGQTSCLGVQIGQFRK